MVAWMQGGSSGGRRKWVETGQFLSNRRPDGLDVDYERKRKSWIILGFFSQATWIKDLSWTYMGNKICEIGFGEKIKNFLLDL